VVPFCKQFRPEKIRNHALPLLKDLQPRTSGTFYKHRQNETAICLTICRT
jgi:hypothetical protein